MSTSSLGRGDSSISEALRLVRLEVVDTVLFGVLVTEKLRLDCPSGGNRWMGAFVSVGVRSNWVGGVVVVDDTGVNPGFSL